MNYRWLWWSILGAALAIVLVYALVLALDRLSPGRPSARARLVWFQIDRPLARMPFDPAGQA